VIVESGILESERGHMAKRRKAILLMRESSSKNQRRGGADFMKGVQISLEKKRKRLGEGAFLLNRTSRSRGEKEGGKRRGTYNILWKV